MSETEMDAVIRGLIAEHRNWGRWGADDELGTMNLITPDAVLRGVAAVRSGERVSLGRVLSPKHGDDNPNPVLHFMTHAGEGATDEGMSSSSDWIGLEFHGYAMSHLDAPSHLFFDGRMYNDRPASVVKTSTGAHFGSVDAARHGISTRGVLLDLPVVLGKPWLTPGHAVGPEVLERAEFELGVRAESGDALLVRTGRDARRQENGPANLMAGGFAGLSAACVPWLAARDIAVLASDAVSDAMQPGPGPHPMPVHAAGIVGLGLWLLDNLYLEDLSAACTARGAWDFQLSVAPLRIKNGTGSPVNPIVVL